MGSVISTGCSDKGTRQDFPQNILEDYRRLHAKDFIRLLGIGHTAFYDGLKKGRYPQPDGYDRKRPIWHQKTAYAFLSSNKAGGDSRG